ncbi:unnamed protein product, partial [Phaeothamnion confervicola]
FQAREGWQCNAGTAEEFGSGCMALGNVDNDPSGTTKIVTGSFQGVLRVYLPSQMDFRIEDVLLEQNLGAPILQLAVGRFIPMAAEVLAVAVLHPRRLAVYTVDPVGGVNRSSERASYFNLSRAYEHLLGPGGAHFTASNMAWGPFGGVDKDLIAVQSMDGRVQQVFEQDVHAFTRRLGRILLPGPLCYVASADALVTCSSDFCIEAYKYQVLAASEDVTAAAAGGGSGGGGGGDGGGGSGMRAAQADWSTKVGEGVLDIFVARFGGAALNLGGSGAPGGMAATTKPGGVDIVVLGERTLFALRDNGSLRLQKRLDALPAAACRYAVTARDPALCGRTVAPHLLPLIGEENLVLGTHDAQLCVYRGVQLAWAARAGTPAVALAVGEFAGLPGLVCALAADGALSIMYMGTDPPTRAVASAVEAKELDYAAIEREHRALLQVIKMRRQRDGNSDGGDGGPDGSGGGLGRLIVRAQVPALLDTPDMAGMGFDRLGGGDDLGGGDGMGR